MLAVTREKRRDPPTINRLRPLPGRSQPMAGRFAAPVHRRFPPCRRRRLPFLTASLWTSGCCCLGSLFWPLLATSPHTHTHVTLRMRLFNERSLAVFNGIKDSLPHHQVPRSICLPARSHVSMTNRQSPTSRLFNIRRAFDSQRETSFTKIRE